MFAVVMGILTFLVVVWGVFTYLILWARAGSTDSRLGAVGIFAVLSGAWIALGVWRIVS